MGIDVHVLPEGELYIHECEELNRFSRSFSNVLIVQDADAEIPQIELALRIDLSLLKVTDESDAREFFLEYQPDNPLPETSWAPVEQLRIVVNDLLHRMRENPEFHHQIKPWDGRPWDGYFEPQRRGRGVDDPSYIWNVFREDLEALVKCLECLEKHGVKRVTFRYE